MSVYSISESGKHYIKNQSNIVDQILNMRNEVNETKLSIKVNSILYVLERDFKK